MKSRSSAHAVAWPTPTLRRLCVAALVAAHSARASPISDSHPLVRQQAQGGTVAGRVTDARTSQGVPGASIEVDGTRLGAIADDEGRYRITGVPAGARTLGFSAMRRNVTVNVGQEVTAESALEASVVALDQVLVTGTAGAEQRRSIGQAVATIQGNEELSKSAAPDIGALLNARAPGVVISQPTGRLGAGPSIQIRGRSSIGLGNSPVVYIDGVRVNISLAPHPAPGAAYTTGGGTYGTQNCFPLPDVERINNPNIGS